MTVQIKFYLSTIDMKSRKKINLHYLIICSRANENIEDTFRIIFDKPLYLIKH